MISKTHLWGRFVLSKSVVRGLAPSSGAMPTAVAPLVFAGGAELVVETADGTLQPPQRVEAPQSKGVMIQRYLNTIVKYRLQGLGRSLAPFELSHALSHGRVVVRGAGPVLQLKVQEVEADGEEEEDREEEEEEEEEGPVAGGGDGGWVPLVSLGWWLATAAAPTCCCRLHAAIGRCMAHVCTAGFLPSTLHQCPHAHLSSHHITLTVTAWRGQACQQRPPFGPFSSIRVCRQQPRPLQLPHAHSQRTLCLGCGRAAGRRRRRHPAGAAAHRGRAAVQGGVDSVFT